MGPARTTDDDRSAGEAVVAAVRDLAAEQAASPDATNGKEGLRRLTAAGTLPTVVLVDGNMPEMDGLQFITAVRSDERYSGMPVLMVTTETETDRMLRALSAGADEYLMKPFQKEGLVDKLRLVGVVK